MRKTGITTRIPLELHQKIQKIAEQRKIRYSDAGREFVKEYSSLKNRKRFIGGIKF